jgi:hypothetical protein
MLTYDHGGSHAVKKQGILKPPKAETGKEQVLPYSGRKLTLQTSRFCPTDTDFGLPEFRTMRE